MPFFTINGYSVIKEIYLPDYSLQNQQAIATDQRTTVYWNPNLAPAGKDGIITIDFYNNDVSKKWRIVVEGFDATGKLVHLEKIVGN